MLCFQPRPSGSVVSVVQPSAPAAKVAVGATGVPVSAGTGSGWGAACSITSLPNR